MYPIVRHMASRTKVTSLMKSSRLHLFFKDLPSSSSSNRTHPQTSTCRLWTKFGPPLLSRPKRSRTHLDAATTSSWYSALTRVRISRASPGWSACQTKTTSRSWPRTLHTRVMSQIPMFSLTTWTSCLTFRSNGSWSATIHSESLTSFLATHSMKISQYTRVTTARKSCMTSETTFVISCTESLKTWRMDSRLKSSTNHQT